MANPWTAIAGAVVGGLFGSISAYNQAQKKAKAYRQAADMMKDAAEKYTGENADEAMRQAGLQRAILSGNANQTNVAPNLDNQNTSQAQAVNAANNILGENDIMSGYNSGSNIKAQENAGQMAKTNAEVQNMLKQADVDYNVSAAGTQALMNGLSTAGKLYNQIKSDERVKESPDDGIDDNKLFDAIEQFKTLSAELKSLKSGKKHHHLISDSRLKTGFGKVIRR